MHTGLKFEAPLTTGGLAIVRALHEARSQGKGDPWLEVHQRWPSFEWLSAWAQVGRANFIPFGVSSVIPGWPGQTSLVLPVVRGKSSSFTWVVRCALKDYKREIAQFLTTVLPMLIAEEVTAEIRYEEVVTSTLYRAKPMRLRVELMGGEDTSLADAPVNPRALLLPGDEWPGGKRWR